VDWRVEFSRWWLNEFKTVKFPSHGTVFDYYIDTETKKFEPWSKRVPTFELDPDVPLQARNQTSHLFCSTGWLGSRAVNVLDSGAEGPGFKSLPRRCSVTVLGKLFTPIVPLFTKQQNW